MKPDQAIETLKTGNLRFVNEQVRNPRQSSDYRKRQTETQNPFCAILACADSRVPVEILFDQGIGDLFVVRNAGNVASLTAIESLNFAAHALQVSLILVMGHQNCGAVNAVVNHLADDDLGRIASMISPAIAETKTIKEAVIANIESQVNTIESHCLIQPQLETGSLKVGGAYYDLETGLVTFL